MKTLCQLVLQYKSDVETRIQCIKDNFDNNESAHYDESAIKDYEEQLAHWEAILAEIDETIESNRIAFELDNPEEGEQDDSNGNV
jgi:hypothetical protein